MNYCGKCGCELADDAVFCPDCGTRIVAASAPRSNGDNNGMGNQGYAKGPQTMPQTPPPTMQGYPNNMPNMGYSQQYQAVPQYCRDESVLVDPNERIIARFGGGWLVNLIALGKVRRVCGILTDRRCYIQGSMLEKGKIRQKKFESIVNVEDINATWFSYERKIGYLVWAIILSVFFIFILPLIGAGLLYWQYFKSKITIFNIQHPGGELSFMVYGSDFQQVKMFAKQIHVVKDCKREAIRNELASMINNNQ